MKLFLTYVVVLGCTCAMLHLSCGSSLGGAREGLASHEATQQILFSIPPEQQCATIGSVVEELQSKVLGREVYKRSQETLGKELSVYELRDMQLLNYQLAQCQKLYQVFSNNVFTQGKTNPMLKSCFLNILDAERSRQRCGLGMVSFLDNFVKSIECDFNEIVSVQFLGELIGQMILFMGDSYADQLFSVDDQKEQQALIDRIKSVQGAFQTKQRELAEKRTTDLANLDSIFSEKVKALQDAMPKAQAFQQGALRYIQRLININKPTEIFIDTKNAFNLEQMFAGSQMLTPNNGYTWYNLFAAGNWLYDVNLKAFVQRGVPVGSSFSTASGINNSDIAGQNLIFTEFYTDTSSYTITTELTLINAAFPFCAGLVFNKARWISGNYDRMNSYRFVGLYGDKDKNVGIYALQTQDTTKPPIKMLLSSQAGSDQLIYSLSKDEVAAIGKTPLTYRIKVGAQQDQIDVTIVKIAAGQSSPQQIAYKQMSLGENYAINQLLFWYHGLGFIAPGCQAAFKLVADSTSPSPVDQLVYTTEQINDFQSKVFPNTVFPKNLES